MLEKWDMKEFKNYRDKIRRLYSITKNDYFLAVLNMYDAELYGTKVESDFKISIYTIRKIIDEFKQNFYQLDETIYLYLANVFRRLDILFVKDVINRTMFSLPKYEVSCEKLKDVSYQFFEHLDSQYVLSLNNIYDKKLIRFVNKGDVYDSNCIMDNVQGVGWANVVNTHDLDVYSTFNHELMHCMMVCISPNITTSLEIANIKEIQTMFTSFLTNYLLNNKTIKLDDVSEKNLQLGTFLSDYNYFSAVKRYLVSLGQIFELSRFQDKILINDARDIISDRYDINYKSLLDYLCLLPPLNNAADYLMSDIVSLHIMKNYKENPDKGKYLLNKSISSKRIDIISYFDDLEFDITNPDYGIELLLDEDLKMKKELQRIRKNVK